MRDYISNPLKRGEIISESELYQCFIEENKTYEECCRFFNVSKSKLKKMLKHYGISKPKELKISAAKKTCIEKYGVSHPRKNKTLNDKITAKTKQTCLERYGVESVSQVKEFRDKKAETYR